jgi:hypothetical protein
MTVIFAGKEIEVKDLIAQCLVASYLQFGFADDGEADKAAGRILAVLDEVGCQITKTS